MAAPFTIGGNLNADLVIYEIGPSQGGSAEATMVEISKDNLVWFNVGSAPGGISGLDIDQFGFTAHDFFRFIRLTDTTLNTAQPAGADIDAVEAIHGIPEPSGGLLAGTCLALLAGCSRRSKRHA
jgi:hypothetical protein